MNAPVFDTPPKDSLALTQRLVAAQIHPTSQRLAVAEVLFERPAHLSADEILDRLKARNKPISKATVYNTLGLFVAQGLVREVVVDAGRTLFDSNTEPHHHVYNVDDGTLTDVSLPSVALTALPEAPVGTEVIDVDVIIRVRNAP